LDASAVHPEAYPIVERILQRIQTDVTQVMGHSEKLKGLSPADFTDDRFGIPTVRDIFTELEKPGRDPRPEFKTARFQEDVNTLADLKPGMVLEGVVTNVANFGAFVDIGVHQDGLVHISALSDRYVKEARDIVRVGQTVKVKVLEIDLARKRVGLTMRLNDDLPAARSGAAERAPGGARRSSGQAPAQQHRREPANAMAEAFARLKR